MPFYEREFLELTGMLDTTSRKITSFEAVLFRCKCGATGERKWNDAKKTNKLYGFYYQCDPCRKEKYKNRGPEWLENIRKAAQRPEHKARAIENSLNSVKKYTPDKVLKFLKDLDVTFEGDITKSSNTITVFWRDGISRRVKIRKFMKEGKIDKPVEENFWKTKHKNTLKELGLDVEIISDKKAKLTYKGVSWEQRWVNHVDKKCKRKMENIDTGLRITELLDSGVSLARACKIVGVDHNRYYRNRKIGVNAMDTALAAKNFERIISIDGAIYDKKHPLCSYRPDILVEDKRLIIEVDGMWKHCEKTRAKGYHANKWDEFNHLGYKFLSFSHWEVLNKKPIVDSMINHKLGKSKKIYARKTEIAQVTREEADLFFEENHIRGKGMGDCVGLFLNGELVCALRYRTVKEEIHISRFANILNHTVIGGYSKLLKRLPSNINIINFVDRRHGSGERLLDIGFVKVGFHVGFEWTNGTEHWNRRKFLGNSGYEFGLTKFWDYGQIKYVRFAAASKLP